MSEPIIELRRVCKAFGGVVANKDVSLTVARGSITGLIGPNGSGKTTVFNLLTDTIRADSGEIVFDGQRLDGKPPWKRAHAGLGRTFQITRLFGEMTVLENVVAVQRSFSVGQLGRNRNPKPIVQGARKLAKNQFLWVGHRLLPSPYRSAGPWDQSRREAHRCSQHTNFRFGQVSHHSY